MAIEAVIFDIGGVFIELDFSRAVRRAAAALNRSPEDVMERLFGAGGALNADRMAWMNEYECGRIGDAEFHAKVERRLGAAVPFEVFTAAWCDVFLQPIHDTMDLAGALHARGLKVGVLSNNNALHWRVLRPMLPVVEKLKYVFLSHEIGLRKPKVGAFQYALEKMGGRAERTVFVDDLEENILAAKRMGMKTVHAANPRAVREGLAALGLINFSNRGPQGGKSAARPGGRG
ncbi:MAG TPA: HAD family phosphatase [Planctomycetota bacterium]|nr:HAD family phosphatase [Planctomycetota bacterium]